jgi:hypothetical protein
MRPAVTDACIPALAGLFGYAEASRGGYSVDEAAERLWRVAYTYRRLHAIGVDALPRTPEWEVKCALGLAVWLDAEHASAFGRRVNELRHPSVNVGTPPDTRLELVLDELAHAVDTAELLTGVYLVMRVGLVQALTEYREATNPLADHPSVRIVESALGDETRAVAWGRHAVAAIGGETEAWRRHLDALLTGPTVPELRSRNGPPAPECQVRRDERFRDPFNESAAIDHYCEDPRRPADERAYALAYKRLREMDVPEWMAPIIADAGDEPWGRRVALSRQLWDETRHAMMGEVALERQGVPFHSFPISAVASIALNTRFTPREAHLMLWKIEQDLMAADTGKKHEVEIARAHGDPLLTTFQDFDWADEVLHASTGQRSIVAEFPSRAAAEEAADEVLQRYDRVADELRAHSEQAEWWPQFVAAMRRGMPR